MGIKFYVIAGVIALVAIAVIVAAHNWSCRAHREPEWKKFGPYAVKEVTSGTSLTVKVGLRDRRTEPVTLIGISVPAEFADQAKQNLQAAAGSKVSVECLKEHIIRRPDLDGVVFSEGGVCLQVVQLRAGMARLIDRSRKDWVDAEDEAKKAKRGIWKSEKKHWWNETEDAP